MTIIIYLLKLVGCSALFFGYYYFFLRNKRLHHYNRLYILLTTGLSIVLPLIKMPLVTIASQEKTLANTLQGIAFGGWENEIVVTASQGFIHSLLTKQNLLLSIYFTGFLIAAYPVIKSFLYIRSLSLKHKAAKFENILFYETAEPGSPFSFFNRIFWNKEIMLESEEGRQILRHEMYHVQQKHSYEVLLMQLTCSLLWFNPFCYLMNRELKIIHEFLADEYASSCTNPHQYAEMLVMQAVSPQQVFMSHQFFYNQIKRRITMILQNDKTSYNYLRKVMTVPVVLLMFCACSVKSKDAELVKSPTQEKMVSGTIINGKTLVMPPTSEERLLNDKQDNKEIFTKLEIQASYPGGLGAWMKYLNRSFKYPVEAQANEIQGTVIIQFIIDKEGNVSNVEAIQGPAKGGLKEEGIRIIKNSGKWLPGVQNGNKVSSYKKQTITFKLEEG